MGEAHADLLAHYKDLRKQIDQKNRSAMRKMPLTESQHRLTTSIATAEAFKSEKLVYTDKLTGLANRHAVEEELTRRLANNEKFILVYMDLDAFKQINDEQGHKVGDEAIVRTGKILKKNIRLNRKDFLCRLSGDEFCLILDSNDVSLPTKIKQRFETVIVDDQRFKDLTLSVGFTRSDSSNSHQTLETLLHQADLAMYDAKRSKSPYPLEYRPIMETAVNK